MRKFIPLAVAAALAATAAQAETILVDDFNLPNSGIYPNADQFVSIGAATTHCYFTGAAGACSGGTAIANSVTAQSLATERDVSVTLTQNNSLVGNMFASVGGPSGAGRLNFQASTGDVGIGSVAWTLPTFTLPDSSSSYFFSVIASTVGNNAPTEIGFTFTGSLGTFSVAAQNVGNFPSNSSGSPLSYAVSSDAAAKLSGGGVLTMNITGGQGWSIALDQFAFSVPEPTSIALAGLALIGAGLASRRRKA